MLGKLLSVSLAIYGVVSVAHAQDSWATQLVEPRKLDFGVIATGSESLKLLTIENTTNAVLHISGTSPGCQCVVPSAPSQSLLQPGEKATVEVRMNTKSFKQQRDTYLTITIDAPQYATVKVPVTAYIRTDVVFTPGKIDFGSREVGAGGEVPCKIAYAGRADWKILDIKYSNKALNAVLKEVARNPGLGTADFELTMTLSPEAPPGRIREIVTIVTDDASSPNVPLMVEGIVKSDITLANNSVGVGALKPGDVKTVQVVVQGTKPFVVEDVDCPKMQDCFKVELDSEEKKLQIVRIQFTAPDSPGKFAEEMIVKIKGRQDTYRFTVSGEIR